MSLTPKKSAQYGNLANSSEHYARLWQVESSRDPNYFTKTFYNSDKTAGPLQLRRIAFDDLKAQGYFKDKRYEDLTPNEAFAGSMKYSNWGAENYGLKDEYWNALGYNQGFSRVKRLYDKYAGDLKKALNDPVITQEGVDYLKKYLNTKIGDAMSNAPELGYSKEMYNTILKGGDVNSINPAKYFTDKKADGGEPVGTWLTMPGMTKYTTSLAPLATAGANAIGMNANNENGVFAGAGLGALSGFLSGGPLGAILGGGSSLLGYAGKMAAKQNADDEAEKAFMKSHTIPGRTGYENAQMYADGGNAVDPNKPQVNATNTTLPPVPITAQDNTIVKQTLPISNPLGPTQVHDFTNAPQNKTYGYSKGIINNPVLDSMLVENGGPFIDTSGEVGMRAHYSSANNTMHVGHPGTNGENARAMRDNILSELPHAQQFTRVANAMRDSSLDIASNALKDLSDKKILDNNVLNNNPQKLKNSFYNTVGDSMRYDIPGTSEYDAHTIIQPKLEQEYSTRIDKFRNQPRNDMDINKAREMATTDETLRQFFGVDTPLLPNIAGQTIHNMNVPPRKYGGTAGFKKALGGLAIDPTKPYIMNRDTIYPNNSNQYLFDQFKKNGIKPNYLVHETGKGPIKELSTFEKGLKTTDEIMSAPARATTWAVTKALTGEGKYVDPSEAMGINAEKHPWIAGGVNLFTDPVNLMGVGVAEKIFQKVIPKLVKVGKATEIADKSDMVIKTSMDAARKYMRDPKNLKDFYSSKYLDADKFKAFTDFAYKEMPEIKNVVEKSLKLNKPEAAIALINDAINIKEGGGNYDSMQPHYPEGDLLSQNFSQNKNNAIKKSLSTTSKQIKPKTVTSNFTPLTYTPPADTEPVTPVTPESKIPISIYNKRVNGQSVPITKKEYDEVLSQGTPVNVGHSAIEENQRDKIKFYEKKEYGGPIFDPKSLEGDIISTVLMNRNRGLNFVDRAYHPENYPTLQTNKIPGYENAPNDQFSTHLMSWGTDDKGQAYMSPDIQFDPITKNLIYNPGGSKEAIKIPNNYADYISDKGYKHATNIPTKEYGGYVEGGQYTLPEAEIKRLQKLGYVIE